MLSVSYSVFKPGEIFRCCGSLYTEYGDLWKRLMSLQTPLLLLLLRKTLIAPPSACMAADLRLEGGMRYRPSVFCRLFVSFCQQERRWSTGVPCLRFPGPSPESFANITQTAIIRPLQRKHRASKSSLSITEQLLSC